MSYRVLIAAGGTGGHVFPGLAVAAQLQQSGVEVTWIGTRQGLEARLVPEAGIEVDWISINGLRGKRAVTLLLAPFKVTWACLQAASVILKRRPHLVLGMGGFVSGPAGLMAWLMRRPLVVHEQNARAGLTNRLLAKIARTVFEAFPNSFRSGTETTTVGNPVRAELAAIPAPIERLHPRETHPRLLVIGGSLGALALNKVIPEAIARLEPELRPEVRHQAGTRTIAEARDRYEHFELDVEPVPFIDDMAEAYDWADLIICRAGALTVSEVAAVGIPAIFVPYPHAVDDHQAANAAYLVDGDAALMIRESELTAEKLADAIRVLLTDRLQRLSMAEHARAMALTDADKKVAEHCLALMEGAA